MYSRTLALRIGFVVESELIALLAQMLEPETHVVGLGRIDIDVYA